MNYIVFDLEWNQSPGGKKYSNSRLPFEIIEIGAVKMNEQREVVDVFQRLVKPQVYNWIHDSIHEVIHVDYKDLADGEPFQQAVREFLKWCGEEYVFCTWGNQDVMELQRNMKYYGMLSLLPGPVTYYDVQKIYGICHEEAGGRRSLEFAIDQMGIPKAQDFHRALTDARYTGDIFKTLEPAAVCVNSSIDVYQNPKNKKEEILIDEAMVEELMGKRIFTFDKSKNEDKVGVVTGMAWTAYGGDTLPVETVTMPGNGKLQLTGQLGDVMQESAKTAYSYVRANAKKFGIDEDFYKKKDIHIHAPEGAVPKDGPSAGVTMVTALVSALTGKKVKGNVAMTGEVTLTGQVLPIGGLKEKSLAAYRYGIDTIIIPKENEKDIEKIPDSIKNNIKI